MPGEVSAAWDTTSLKWLVIIGTLGYFTIREWRSRRQGTEVATEEKKMARPPRIQTYQDSKGEWRWRLRASNGRIIAEGGEGYKTKQGITRAVDTVVEAFSRCEIEGDGDSVSD